MSMLLCFSSLEPKADLNLSAVCCMRCRRLRRKLFIILSFSTEPLYCVYYLLCALFSRISTWETTRLLCIILIEWNWSCTVTIIYLKNKTFTYNNSGCNTFSSLRLIYMILLKFKKIKMCVFDQVLIKFLNVRGRIHIFYVHKVIFTSQVQKWSSLASK